MIHISEYKVIDGQIENHLKQFHAKYPYMIGDGKENIKARLPEKIPSELSEQILKKLVNDGKLEFVEHKVKLKSHNITLTDKQEKIKSKLIGLLEQNRFMPPSYEDLISSCANKDDAEIAFKSMLETGELIKISSNIFFLDTILEEGKKLIVQYLRENQEITISEAKQVFGGATRKYTVPLMEYFDKKGITTRWGDRRFLNE